MAGSPAWNTSYGMMQWRTFVIIEMSLDNPKVTKVIVAEAHLMVGTKQIAQEVADAVESCILICSFNVLP